MAVPAIRKVCRTFVNMIVLEQSLHVFVCAIHKSNGLLVGLLYWEHSSITWAVYNVHSSYMRVLGKVSTHEQARQIFYSELSWQQEPEFNSDTKSVTNCENMFLKLITVKQSP